MRSTAGLSITVQLAANVATIEDVRETKYVLRAAGERGSMRASGCQARRGR